MSASDAAAVAVNDDGIKAFPKFYQILVYHLFPLLCPYELLMLGRTSSKMWNARQLHLETADEQKVRVNCSCYQNVTICRDRWNNEECVGWCTGCAYYIAMEFQVTPFCLTTDIMSLNEILTQKKTSQLCSEPSEDAALGKMIDSAMEFSKYGLLTDLLDDVTSEDLIERVRLVEPSDELCILNMILDIDSDVDHRSELSPMIFGILLNFMESRFWQEMKDHDCETIVCKNCGAGMIYESIICIDVAMNLPPIRGYKVVMDRSVTAYFCVGCLVEYICSFIESGEASALVRRVFDRDGEDRIVRDQNNSYGDLRIWSSHYKDITYDPCYDLRFDSDFDDD